MNNSKKDKFLILLVLLLMVANITSIAIFWLGKPNPKPDRQKGTPSAFLIAELNFNKQQQDQLEIFRKEHIEAAEPLRKQLANNKNVFFKLLQQPALADTQIINAENAVTAIIQKLDLLAFDHFKKVRKICTDKQKEKFDKIIGQVAHIIGNPGNPPPPGDNQPGANNADNNKPPNNEKDDRPAPPENN